MKFRATTTLAWALLLLPILASASIWHVEKDGSGDFAVIQDAVDAASDGDTIKIGPGRYEDFFEYHSTDVWNIALVEDKSLTFVGAGVEKTILGPEEIGIIDSPFVNCIKTYGDGAVLQVANIRFENVQADGIRMAEPGRIEVDDCEFENCGGGLWGYFRDGGWISSCRFVSVGSDFGYCVKLKAPSVGVVIEECDFLNYDISTGVGGDWAGTQDNLVVRCRFFGGHTGVVMSAGASATISNCYFKGQTDYGILGQGPGTLRIEDCQLDMSGFGGHCFCPYSGSGDYILLNNTLINDGDIIRLYTSRITLECHGNHFIRTGDDTWYLHPGDSSAGHQGDLRSFDFTDNYWGTDDPDEVATWIFDLYDDTAYRYFIDFEPMGEPVAVESRSWSGVKALFAN